MYKIVISYCVRLCAILNLQFLLVFTAMLMLCSLLWFKEINELIRLFVNLLKVGTFRLSVKFHVQFQFSFNINTY
jgi:hypothetical protein